MNDPAILDWLDSKEGRIWLANEFHPIAHNDGWASWRDDVGGDCPCGAPDCWEDEAGRWFPGQVGISYSDNSNWPEPVILRKDGDKLVIEITVMTEVGPSWINWVVDHLEPAITDKVLAWPHP